MMVPVEIPARHPGHIWLPMPKATGVLPLFASMSFCAFVLRSSFTASSPASSRVPGATDVQETPRPTDLLKRPSPFSAQPPGLPPADHAGMMKRTPALAVARSCPLLHR